jgi:acrylyl-CoA reductase (NADPH)
MLAVMALEEHGLEPRSGDVLVTGRGRRCRVDCRRAARRPWLSRGRLDRSACRGALSALARRRRRRRPQRICRTGQAAGQSRFAGAVDSVGSTTLANLLSQINYGGAVAACGLAQGMDCRPSSRLSSCAPSPSPAFDSVMCPTARRERAWSRLAKDLDLKKLGVITSQVPLDDVPLIAEEIVAGKVRGRVVVDL